MARVHAAGVQAVLQAMGKARRETGKRIEDSLRACAKVLLKTSQPLVPVDTRRLKESGRVEVEGKGLHAKAMVIYETPYAIFVHEDLTKYHAKPTQARYLADAIPMCRGTMTHMLGRALKAGVRDLPGAVT